VFYSRESCKGDGSSLFTVPLGLAERVHTSLITLSRLNDSPPHLTFIILTCLRM